MNKNTKTGNFTQDGLVQTDRIESVLSFNRSIVVFQVEDRINDAIAYQMIVHETQDAVVVFSEGKLRKLFDLFLDLFVLRHIFVNFLNLLLDPILLNCDIVAKIVQVFSY